MIRCEGTLRIKRIRQSRNGAFCIADLTTDFGEFKVKDPLLDQFDEGEYQGTVWISEIYLSQYIAYGKAVTEMRARLHDLQITAEDRRRVPPPEPSDPDPLDETPRRPVSAERPESPASASGEGAAKKSWADFKRPKPTSTPGDAPTAPKPAAESTSPAQAAPAPDTSGASADLFSDEIRGQIERRENVKLDATVDRVMLRSQAAALRAAGYEFRAHQNQTWVFRT